MDSLDWSLLALVAGIIAGVAGARVRRPPSGAAAGEAQATQPTAQPARADGAFARLLHALPIGVVVVDAARRVEFVNGAAGAAFGFDPDRALRAHVIEAIPNVELERRIADALLGEASVAPLTLSGGSDRRVYRVSVYPLSDECGECRRVVVFCDDQTALVRLDRAQKEFLSNVSHELRTPLSSVKLMLETVLEAPGDEARELFVPQALAQVDRLTGLVAALLEQARAESGQLKLDLREVALDEVARPIVASFEPQASHKGVALELLPLRPVRVEADPDRLAQVFVNLVDNALRHTPGGGRIRIELDARDGDAVVRVRDTGEGIPYRDLPHIFERFYVVGRSRARGSGGAGLGLAIVKGIVDAHGGAISAESMLGRGSAFTVRLPIARIKREAEA